MICRDIREAKAGPGERFTFGESLFRGLGPAGGLLFPVAWPTWTTEEIDDLLAMTFPTRAATITRSLLGDELINDDGDERDTIADLANDAFDFDVPLRRLAPDMFTLELFHGPTLAFKDFGARFMARAMARLKTQPKHEARSPDERHRITILAATSGDTGSAVAHAFWRVEGIDVCVLYPQGRVSPLQERQMATLGDNVHTFAVDGRFDDCQRLVKGAFAEPELRAKFGLTTANSINLGRLVPQVFYYFEAVAQWRRAGFVGRPTIGVPSGNFGNLTAGLMAERLGLPINRFVAATNANDVVPRYLDTGDYTPRESVETISNAMDVGDPSNWSRIEHLFGGDRRAIVARVAAERIDDDETRRTMRDLHRASGEFVCPHTAVGIAALRRHRRVSRDAADVDAATDVTSTAPDIVLATAHPAKFREVVHDAVGVDVPIPERLAAMADRPLQSIALQASAEAFRDQLETRLE